MAADFPLFHGKIGPSIPLIQRKSFAKTYLYADAAT
jgi:hypothetical protein